MQRLSFEQFQELMKTQSPLNKWGAILAFDRQRTNEVLLRSYVRRFDGAGYFPVIDSEQETDVGVRWHRLQGIQMDKPRLSFENASITASRANLFMRSVAGKMLEVTRPLGGQYKSIDRLGLIDGLVGPTLSMTINLETAPGGVDSAGKVLLDLNSPSATSHRFSGVDTESEAIKLGGHLRDEMKRWSPEQKRFELSNLRLNPQDKLQPDSFELRTHPAPGATDGEGEVLVFVTLKGGETGTIPHADAAMPYLLPESYSSNLMINHEVIFALLLEELKGVPQFAGCSFVKRESNGVISYEIDGGSLCVPTKTSRGDWGQSAVTEHTLQFKSAQGPMRLEFRDNVFALRWTGQVDVGALILYSSNNGSSGVMSVEWQYEQLFEAAVEQRDGKDFIAVRSNKPVFELSRTWIERRGDEFTYDALDNMAYASMWETWDKFRFLENDLTSISAALDAFRLNGLLFPDESYVKARDIAQPRDLTAVGDLVIPDIALVENEVVVAGGRTHQFKLQNDSGASVTWSVDALPGESDPGTIDADGNYAAPSSASFNHEFKRVIVTASTATASDQALVHLVAKEVSVYPSVMVAVAGASYKIAAASTDAGPLTWTLAGNATGDLAAWADVDIQDGRLYTPKAAAEMPPGSKDIDSRVRVQKITVTNEKGESAVAEALVVLAQVDAATIKVAAEDSRFKFSFWIKNKLGEDLQLEDVEYVVLSGKGTLEGDTYTPSSDGSEKYIVVAAIGDFMGVLSYWNYLILPVPMISLEDFNQLVRIEE
ncbi:hypothetical protein PS627_01241 [Pseudomonas fluorescens]|uniref:hypothetical protein n=1 Tax=Pseudomonas fluorescens TaxID=294 RepID=UPI00125241E3|nr:hypothetical protein [Pseudomonas fluorescens]CAG8865337.1 hypothetical protein PS627_01241 [Pseudomonas fluorescens]